MTSLWISAPAHQAPRHQAPGRSDVSSRVAEGGRRVSPSPATPVRRAVAPGCAVGPVSALGTGDRRERRRGAPAWWGGARVALALVAVTVLAMAASEVVSRVGRAMVSSPATQLGSVPQSPVIEHRAEAGETLWSLAATLGPSGDLRASLDQLIRLNGASGVAEGQLVLVPEHWFAEPDR